MAKKPFITTPGTVSRSVGRSGKPGKRMSEVTASRRTLPAWTTALAAAIEHHHLVDAAGDVLDHLRAGSIRHFDQIEAGALLNSFAPNAAAPAVLSKAMESLPGLALA